MVDNTIWKLDLQAGNSQATLKAFENSLNIAKDKINQVTSAGQNFEKLSSFQTKAAEAAKKLEVAQASAALAAKKAADAASAGKVSAEQLALMQAKAGQAAQNVASQEQKLGTAMAKVQSETTRLQTAMAEEAVKCESLGKVFGFLKGAAESAASGISSGFRGLQGVISGVSEQVSSFASNMRSNMESARTSIIETEVASSHASGGITSGFHGASGGLLDFASKAGMALNGIQVIVQAAQWAKTALLDPIASAESLGISFTTLMGGSKKAAEDLIKTLNHFADITPFEPEPVQEYAAQLIGMGFDAKETIPIMTSLGDALFGIGHGTEAEMKSVVDQIGKIRVAGVMTWGDISQLQTHGIDTLGAMSLATGKTKEALRDLAGHGGIPAKEAIDALTKGIEMNPLYKGGMAKQAQSLSGILSTMTGYLKKALNSFLGLNDGMVVSGGIVDRVKGLFQGFAAVVSSDAFQNFVSGAGEKIGGVLGWIGDRLSNVVSPPLKIVTGYFNSSAFHNFASSVGTKIANIFGRIGGVINNDLKPPLQAIIERLKTGFTHFATNIGMKLIDVFSRIGGFIESKVRPPLHAVMAYLESDAFKNFAKGVGQKILDIFSGIGNFLETKVKPPLKSVIDYFQSPAFGDFARGAGQKILDIFGALGGLINEKVAPALQGFWGWIQTQAVPTLQTWGGNIKTWVIDKFEALKTFIETQVMPKLSGFWSYITTQIIPKLQEWGNTIKTHAIDKLNDLKVYIETQVIPKLQQLWSWIQTNIIPLFTTWGDEMSDTRAKLDALKTYIETQVIPKLQALWQWIQVNIIPIFQSLKNVITTDVMPHLGGFKDSVDKLTGALGHLWNAIAPVLLPVLGILAFLVYGPLLNAFNGIKPAIDIAGAAINALGKGINISINGVSMWINWIASAIDWVNALGRAVNNFNPANLFNKSGAPNKPTSKPATAGGGGSVGSFASGVENFGGGLAFVHANELLVNLPKGTSVWNPAKTAQFMQGLKMPTPTFAMSAPATSSGSSSSGNNEQVVGLLAAILDALQKQNRGGNVTMNANVAANSVDAQRINQMIQSLGGRKIEEMQRGAW